MKQLIALIYLLLFTGYSLADGAFGTYNGMTKKELENKGVKIKFVRGNYLSEPSFNAPIKNKFIKQYSYGFTGDQKLCLVKAETKLQVNENKIKTDFNNFVSLLNKKYGPPKLVENNQYIWVNMSNDIAAIKLYLVEISLDKTNKNDFNDAPPPHKNDRDFEAAVNQVIIEEEIAKYNPNKAAKSVLEYEFKNCRVTLQDSYIDKMKSLEDEKKFLKDSEGL